MGNIAWICFGDAAAGILRHLVQDNILILRDNLSVGPLVLDNWVEARKAFWSPIFAANAFEHPDNDVADEDVIKRVAQSINEGTEVRILRGAWAFERLGTVYLLHRLAQAGVDWTGIRLLHFEEDSASATSRAQISSALDKSRKIEAALAEQWIEAFRQQSASAPDLRFTRGPWTSLSASPWCELDDTIHGVAAATIDEVLLGAVSGEWTQAAWAVGSAMMDVPIGDLYLNWRLHQLVESGRLEYQGELRSLRDYEIKRLAQDIQPPEPEASVA